MVQSGEKGFFLVIWGRVVFRGVSTINLDVKGRIAIPTRYRAELQESCERQMIVTIAMNGRGAIEKGCLLLYPLPEWEKIEVSISKLPAFNEMTERLNQFFIGNATECEMDGQGRLLIPEKLRKLAGLEKHIALVGQLHKFDVWDGAVWDRKEAGMMNGEAIPKKDLEEIKDFRF